MSKYKIEYTRNGKNIALFRHAEDVEEAMDKIADQYDWPVKLRQYDADTRGKEWGEFAVSPYNERGFMAYVTRVTA